MSPGDQPLAGRGVLVTRPAGHGGDLASGLERLGARVHCVPAIQVTPRAGDLAHAVSEAGRHDWLVFTSANATTFFLGALGPEGIDTLADQRAQQGRPMIAAIGDATAGNLTNAGLPVDLVPGEFHSEGLLAALVARGVVGKSVMIPAALVTRDVLPVGLAAAGATVRKIPIYETVASREGAGEVHRLLSTGAIDLVTFTSSSTVDAFHELAPAPPAGLVYAAIGPVTAETARARGYAPLVIAKPSTVSGLLDALVAHYQRGKD